MTAYATRPALAPTRRTPPVAAPAVVRHGKGRVLGHTAGDWVKILVCWLVIGPAAGLLIGNALLTTGAVDLVPGDGAHPYPQIVVPSSVEPPAPSVEPPPPSVRRAAPRTTTRPPPATAQPGTTVVEQAAPGVTHTVTEDAPTTTKVPAPTGTTTVDKPDPGDSSVVPPPEGQP